MGRGGIHRDHQIQIGHLMGLGQEVAAGLQATGPGQIQQLGIGAELQVVQFGAPGPQAAGQGQQRLGWQAALDEFAPGEAIVALAAGGPGEAHPGRPALALIWPAGGV